MAEKRLQDIQQANEHYHSLLSNNTEKKVSLKSKSKSQTILNMMQNTVIIDDIPKSNKIQLPKDACQELFVEGKHDDHDPLKRWRKKNTVPADRILASIRRVYSCQKHINADRLYLVQIASPGSDAPEAGLCLKPCGWQMVTDTQYQPGELVIFVEIDSVLPAWSDFEFMKSHKYRVKSIKLRGQVSQGLIFPLNKLDSWLPNNTIPKEEGTDLTEALEISKFCANSEYGEWSSFNGLHPFPSDVCDKTGESRVQNVTWSSWNQEALQDCYVTEKLHGTSSTFVFDQEAKITHVCSRNNLRDEDDSVWWKMAKHMQANNMEKFKEFCPVVVQGEICGPSINGNHYNLASLTLYLFTASSPITQQRLPFEDLSTLATLLDCQVVPVIHKHLDITGWSSQRILTELAENKSTLNPDVLQEGVVVRACANPKLSFKAINNEMLLAEAKGRGKRKNNGGNKKKRSKNKKKKPLLMCSDADPVSELNDNQKDVDDIYDDELPPLVI